MTILVATIGGVLALLFWGVSDYLAGKSGQDVDAPSANFLIQVAGFIAMSPFLLWYGLPSYEFETVLIIAAVSVLMSVAYISFVKSLASGPFGVAAPLANSYAFVTLLFGLLVFKLTLSLLQTVALVVILIGVVMLATDRNTLHLKTLKGPTIIFALIAMFAWGIGFGLIDFVVAEISWFHLLYPMAFFTSVLGFLYYVIAHKVLPSPREFIYSRMKYGYWAGVLLSVGAVVFFAATEFVGSVVIPAIIASASPLVTSLLAKVYDKEDLTWLKRVGAVIIVVGLVLLNIY